MYRSHLPSYKRQLVRRILVLFVGLNCTALSLSAQKGTFLEQIVKPSQYESRTLTSERSSNKKFTVPRRFYNNLVSRFNYYFNANTKLNEIIERAKAASPDDYTQLLPFYKYSLDVTSKDHLDSVIYKTTAGILLHDLRSDWVDKLYLLMGKAYLLRKDFDSANMVFQYINYAFSPKDDGYDIPIGSNASNTHGVFTIATKENRSLWKRVTSIPPSRNESFILQARNYIEQEKYIEAASLLEILRTDPNFPTRLQSFLHETIAYVMYKQQAWATAALHLTKALEKTDDKNEVPRWEFLAAQLYQKAGNDELASELYERSIKHTTDPLMEIYARLNRVSLSTGSRENALQHNLDELLKMAKRDKYESTRDIIYFAAAGLELRRKNYQAAHELLLKSILYNTNNPSQRQESFLVLGDLNYTRKSYGLSYAYYDSIQVALLKEADQPRVKERKPALQVITQNIITIHLQDSLQKLAAMGVEDRNIAVRKTLKQLRKEKGLKDIPAMDPGYTSSFGQANPNLFPGTGAGSGSEFYFLNASLRAKGAVEFKSKWGNRPNVDNWRRQTAVDRTLNTAKALQEIKATTGQSQENDLTFESLYKNIPLNAVQRDSSNAAIIKSLLGNALTFQNRLEDYPSAIEVYEELLRRFPESVEVEQALFNLAYCYRKVNDLAKADAVTERLNRSFAGGKYAAQLNQGSVPKKADPAEKQYANIYRMFIEGRFNEAKEAKLQADKQFGNTYWTPQLLYIESIYYIKQRQDSTAINRLQSIATLFNKTPLAEKAVTMIDVLKRRNEIENYLANLKVDRKDEDLRRGIDLDSTNPFTGLSTKKQKPFTPPDELASDRREIANIWDKSTIGTDVTRAKRDSGLIIPKAPVRGLSLEKASVDATIRKSGYSFNVTDTQFVAVVLEKVDPIFVTESRNAFSRFNQERFAADRITIGTQKIGDQFEFLLFGPFPNAGDAMGYIDKTRPLTASRIMPWLTADKYSFLIISGNNLRVLMETKDMAAYRAFMHEVFPDKF